MTGTTLTAAGGGGGGYTSSATAPVTPVAGDRWYNTDTGVNQLIPMTGIVHSGCRQLRLFRLLRRVGLQVSMFKHLLFLGRIRHLLV